MTPSHCSLSVCGNAFEHFVGITSEIVAYWYHGWINKGYTCTSTKNMEIQEEHERENSCIFFTSHNPSVYRGFRRKGEEWSTCLDLLPSIPKHRFMQVPWYLFNEKVPSGRNATWNLTYYFLFIFFFPWRTSRRSPFAFDFEQDPNAVLPS